MKNTYTLKGLFLLLVTGLLAALPAQAQISFAEDFNYPVGKLTEQSGGKWLVPATYYYKNPVQVAEGAMSVSGCPLGTTTHVASMGNADSNESAMALFTDDDHGITTGDIWLAAYVSVDQESNKHTPFLTFVGRSATTDVSTNNAPYMWGNITYGPGTVSGKYRLGVTWNRNYAPKDGKMTADLDYGTTYLVVARLTLDGQGNESITFFFNPTDYINTPSDDTAIGSEGTTYGNKNGYGFKAIMLNQSLSWGYNEGKLQVGALRVSDTYAGLFASSAPKADPTLAATFGGQVPAAVYKHVPFKGELTLTGSDLTADVTLTSSSSDLTFSRTTIPASEVMAAGGVKVPFTVSYSGSEAQEELSAKVTIGSEGATAVDTTLTWYAATAREITSLKAFQSEQAETYEALAYTGHAVVTYVDKTTTPATYYLQDADGGITLNNSWETAQAINWEQGDSVGAFAAYVGASLGMNFIVPGSMQTLTANAHDQKAEAVSATIADIKASPATYVNRLVRIKNVTLSGFDEGAQFAEGMTQPTYTDADGLTGKMRIFKGTSLIGTDIPSGKIHLTGILTSKAVTNGPIVAPRGTADLEEALAPSFEIDQTQFLKARGKVGETIEVGTVHVKSVAQEKDITIVPSAAVEGIYSASVTTIPAGTFDDDVKILYTATKIGKDKGNLYFMQGDDVLATVKLEGMATDPANPPAISLKPASLSKEMKAFAGEEVKDTVTVTPFGMPDYVKVAVTNDTPGAFTASTSLLMTQGEQKLIVTFRPTTAGTYTGTVTISNEFIDPIVLRYTGVATDKPVIPEKEGDDLPLSTASPLKQLTETFDGGEHNKPIALEGWKNLAIDGTRAWWGYTFPDYDTDNAGEHAAKVTAYDSKVEAGDESRCQMLLVSPALDFVNAPSKFFTFRVMGQNLTDDMTDTLELCYIWVDGDEMHVEPIEGVSIPASKNESGEWVDFHVDLTGQNIDPVFFMGFRFTSQRGTEHAAVYYIDDVTYGSTTLPSVTTDRPEVTFGIKPGNKETSDPVNVITANLTEPVKVALEGADKDHFQLSTDEVPATGGEFTITFSSTEEGEYAVYVKLSSRGAVTKRIIASAKAAVGISTATVADTDAVAVFDTTGRQLAKATGATIDATLRTLPAGTYVLRFTTADGVKTVKMAR